MVTFDCAASRHDGVTLVTVSLREVAVPTRVTVRNCLDGPVWPPRTEGVPEAGWTETGFAGVVGPGSHALGYATPAPVREPPAELVDAVPAPDADPVSEGTASPADVVRELGDPSPPGDAVPTAATGELSPAGETTDSGPGTADESVSDGLTATSPRVTDGDRGLASAPVDSCPDPAVDAGGDENGRVPPAVGPWLAEMERRTDTAEALAAAETLPEATAAVREAGGLDGVRALAEAADERQLRLLARRARRLAQRRAGAEIPVETLSTLA